MSAEIEDSNPDPHNNPINALDISHFHILEIINNIMRPTISGDIAMAKSSHL
jgi:hypothetical protein